MPSMARLTGSARAAIRKSLGQCDPTTEANLLRVLAQQPRGVARRLLASTGFVPDTLPPTSPFLDRASLITQANADARQRGDNHIGTHHLLLALSRAPNSLLNQAEITPPHLAAALDHLKAHAPRLPLFHRLGTAFRALWDRLRIAYQQS